MLKYILYFGLLFCSAAMTSDIHPTDSDPVQVMNQIHTAFRDGDVENLKEVLKEFSHPLQTALPLDSEPCLTIYKLSEPWGEESERKSNVWKQKKQTCLLVLGKEGREGNVLALYYFWYFLEAFYYESFWADIICPKIADLRKDLPSLLMEYQKIPAISEIIIKNEILNFDYLKVNHLDINNTTESKQNISDKTDKLVGDVCRWIKENKAKIGTDFFRNFIQTLEVNPRAQT